MNVYFAYGFRKRAFDLQQLEGLAAAHPEAVGALAGGVGGALTGGHHHKMRNAVLGALLGGAGGYGYGRMTAGQPTPVGDPNDPAQFEAGTLPEQKMPTDLHTGQPFGTAPKAVAARPPLESPPISGPDGGVVTSAVA